jgi:Fe2+ transport system protein FeoA
MKIGARSFRRRLLELGISSLTMTIVSRHRNGYIIKVRNARYVIGNEGASIIEEMIDNESR